MIPVAGRNQHRDYVALEVAMGYSSHEHALFDRIKQISNSVALAVPSRSFPQEYSLLQVPLTQFDDSSFGLALMHEGSRSVPFWMQVSVLSEGHGLRNQAHVLRRRSTAREHRAAISGLELWLLLDFLSPRFDLVFSRTGLGWDHWLLTASRLARYELSVFAVEENGQRLCLLDPDDLIDQSEEVCQTLSSLESGLLIASRRAGLDARPLSVERSLIMHLDDLWGELG